MVPRDLRVDGRVKSGTSWMLIDGLLVWIITASAILSLRLFVSLCSIIVLASICCLDIEGPWFM